MRHERVLVVVLLLMFVLSTLAPVATAVPRSLPAVTATTISGHDPAVVETPLDLDRSTRRLLQQGLQSAGVDPGTPDGLVRLGTRAAVPDWRRSRRAPSTAAALPPAAPGASPPPANTAVAQRIFDLTPFRDESWVLFNPLFFLPGKISFDGPSLFCDAPHLTDLNRRFIRPRECWSIHRLTAPQPAVFFQAQIAGDVPIGRGQRKVRALASKVAHQPLLDGKRHSTGQFYATMALKLRMMYSKSRPVLPPSFMPKVTYQRIGFKKDAFNEATMHVTHLVFGHHSNGQVDCPFFGQPRNEDGECKFMTPDDVTAAAVNYLSGNFSTHYIQGSWYRRWITLSDGRTIQTETSFGGGIEYHLRKGHGAMDDDLRRRYGGTRLWASIAWEKPSGISVRARGTIILGIVRARPDELTPHQVSHRYRFEVEVVKPFTNRHALYARLYVGQDPYNIHFEREGPRGEVGLRFDWEEVFRVKRGN